MILGKQATISDNVYLSFFRKYYSFILIAIAVGVFAGIAVVYLNQPVYILLGIAGLLVFVLTIYSPQVGLLILVFISYTRFSDIMAQFHNAPSFAKPFLVLLIVSILIRWGLTREMPKGWYAPVIFLGLVLVTEFASVIYSPVPDRSMARFLDDVKDSIIALVVVMLMQTDIAFRRVIYMLIYCGVFLCGLAVFQYLTGTYNSNYGGFAISLSHQIIGAVDDFRATGPMEDPNFFAQIAVVFVPISLERVFHEKNTLNRILAMICLGTSILTVIITYSRGGLFAMIIGVITFFLFYPPKRNQVVVVILAVIIGYSFLPRNYVDRLMTLTFFFQDSNASRLNERSLQGRLSENMAALEMIKDKPFFGVGLNSYKYLFPTYSKKLGLALVASEREAHNTYLEILAETGIIGFLVFALMFGSCIYGMIKARELFLRYKYFDFAGMTIGYLGGFVAYFFAAIFVHNAFPRHYYLILGIAFAIHVVAQNLLESKSDAR